MRTLAAALLLVSSTSFAETLTSSVERLDPEPAVVLRERSAGVTAYDRYHAHHEDKTFPAKSLLVLLIRGEQRNSPDTVTVTRAERDGKKIQITVETRTYSGPLRANIVTTPLIEVTLGALERGDYVVKVRESVLSFTELSHPEKAKSPQPGLALELPFSVK